MNAKHIKNIGFVSIFTLLSRILGLVRDILLVAVFGASFLLDAFVIAFTIPNFFRKLFGEGLMTTIFTPLFQKEIFEKGKKEARILASQTFSWLLSYVIIISFFAILLCLVVIFFFHISKETKTILFLTIIMLPYATIICSIAFFGAILNATEHFIIPSLAPVILNLVWLFILLFIIYTKIPTQTAIYLMSVFIVIAGVTQLLSQIPMLKREKMLLFITCHKQSIKPFWENSIGVMMLQANVLIDRVIAWSFIEQKGSVTVLYIANRFIQFPLAIIGISIATVAFPIFTKNILNKNTKALQEAVMKNINLVFLFSIPASVGLFLISPEIISFFYQHKSFTSNDVTRTVNVLRVYSLFVWVFCFQQILHKLFYSLSDTKTPMKISCISVTVNVILNFLLVSDMKEIGLAIATVVSSIVALVISLYQLKRKVSFSLISSIPFLSKILLSTSIMALSIYAIKCIEMKKNIFLHISLTILISVVIYFFCVWICGIFNKESIKWQK